MTGEEETRRACARKRRESLMWNEALILLIAQMSCLPIRLRPSLHRSEHRCRLIGANAHDYLMVYDIYVIEPIGFHSSPTLTFCPFSASTAQRPEETQEKGTRSLASAETDYLNVTPWIEIGDWVVSEGFASLCPRPLRLQLWTRTAERTRPPSSARPHRLRRHAPSG